MHVIACLSLISAVALLTALILQYFFGFAPCNLCIVERWPYLGIILIGVAYYVVKPKKYHRCWLAAQLLLLIIEAGVSSYHFAIEQGWVEASSTCQQSWEGITDIESLAAALERSLPQCDRPEVFLLGISLTGWNLMLSFSLIAYATSVFFRKGTKYETQ